jgi:hypothetical protein
MNISVDSGRFGSSGKIPAGEQDYLNFSDAKTGTSNLLR